MTSGCQTDLAEVNMAKSKPPKLSRSEDKAASVRIRRRKFNAWCLLQQAWRDTSKCPTTPDHWVAEKAQLEIAAFFLALPDDVLEVFDTTIIIKENPRVSNIPNWS